MIKSPKQKLTLCHERGSAVVKRVNFLGTLAVSVRAHVKLLGPLPEEHLEKTEKNVSEIHVIAMQTFPTLRCPLPLPPPPPSCF